MPLTEEERQEILGRRQAQPAQPLGAFSPYPGMELQGMTVGRTPSMRFGPDPTQRMIAEQKIKQQYPVSTEMERERGAMSGAALAFVDDFAQQLGVDEQEGTVANPELLSLSRELLPKGAQEALQSSKTRQLYNSLDSAFQEAAIVLTGRQGDVQKLKQLQELYRFGAFVKNDPATIVKRIKNLKRLIQTFDKPGVSNEQLSRQMDMLSGDVDENVANLQQQFPGATIRRKQ